MESIRKFITQKPAYQSIAIASIVLFLGVALASSFYRSFNHDEFEAIHSGWKILAGEKIYVDFLQTHHFLWYYLLSGIIFVFGENTDAVIAARILSFAMAVGIVWLTYGIARMAYGKKVAMLSLFLLSGAVIFLQKALEVRPDVPLVLSGLLAVFFLLKYFESKKLWQLVVSSVALFLSFLFLQKAVFLIFLIGLVFLHKLWKKEISWKDFAWYWGGLAVFLGLFIWYVSNVFTWSEYFFWNWTINTKLLNTFPLYKYLWISIQQNPLLWTLYAAGIIVMIKRRSFDVVAFFSIGLLATIFATKSPFAQYYLTSLPFVAIVSAWQLERLLRWNGKLMALLMIATVFGSLYVLYDTSDSNRKQLNRIEYVLSITDKNDIVYDGDANFNLFRKDMDYFWFSVKPKTGILVSYQLLKDYDYDAYRLIGELKPKVISDSFIKAKKSVIADQYEKSSAFGDLYIRK